MEVQPVGDEGRAYPFGSGTQGLGKGPSDAGKARQRSQVGLRAQGHGGDSLENAGGFSGLDKLPFLSACPCSSFLFLVLISVFLVFFYLPTLSYEDKLSNLMIRD